MRIPFFLFCFLSLYTYQVHSQCNGQLLDAFQDFASETTSGGGVIYFVSNSDIYRNDRTPATNLSNSPVLDDQIDSDGSTVVWSGSANSNFNIFKSVNGAPREIVNTGTSTNNRNPAISGNLIVWSGIASGFNIYKNSGSGQQQVSTSLSTSNGWPATDGTNIVWHGLVSGVQRVLMDSGSGPFVIDPSTPGVQTQAKIHNGIVIWRQLNAGGTTSQLYKYENGMTSIVSTGQAEVAANDYDIHNGTIVWINGTGASANAYASVNGGAPELLSISSTENQNVRTSEGNIAWVGKDLTNRVYLKEGSTTTMISENISTNQSLDFHEGVITWVGFRNSSWRVFAKYLTQPSDCCTSYTEVSLNADIDNRIVGNQNGKLIWTGFDDNNKRQVYKEAIAGPALISTGSYDALADVSIDGSNIYWVADNGGDIVKYNGVTEAIIPTSSIFESDPVGDGDVLYWIGRPVVVGNDDTRVYKLQNGTETFLSNLGTRFHSSLRVVDGQPYWIGEDAGGERQVFTNDGTGETTLSANTGFFIEAFNFINGNPVWVEEISGGSLRVYTNTGAGPVEVAPTHPVNNNINERKLLRYQNKLIWKEANSSPQKIYGYDGTTVAEVDINDIPIKDILYINGSVIYYDQIISSTTYLNKWDGIMTTRLTDGTQNSFRNAFVINGTVFYEAADRTNPSIPVDRIYKLSCGDCPDILDVPTATAASYGAETTLTSAAMISSPIMTLFSSGGSVELKKEFSVAPMATLDIVIQSCAEYLGGN